MLTIESFHQCSNKPQSFSTPGLQFPGDSVVKNLPANAGDTSLISGSGRSPGGGNGNPLQDSCLGNSMDRGVWWATVEGVARVRHDLVTKLPLPCMYIIYIALYII